MLLAFLTTYQDGCHNPQWLLFALFLASIAEYLRRIKVNYLRYALLPLWMENDSLLPKELDLHSEKLVETLHIYSAVTIIVFFPIFHLNPSKFFSLYTFLFFYNIHPHGLSDSWLFLERYPSVMSGHALTRAAATVRFGFQLLQFVAKPPPIPSHLIEFSACCLFNLFVRGLYPHGCTSPNLSGFIRWLGRSSTLHSSLM